MALPRRGLWIPALLLLAGCRHGPALPELPQPQVQGLLPAVADQIEGALKEAQAKPRDPAANGQLGMTLHAYRQFDAAAVCYQRARLLEPGVFRWRYYLALVQAEAGRQQEALTVLREGVRLRPDYLPASLRLAELLFNTGDLAASGNLYRELVQQDPRSAEAHLGLGRLLAARGEIAPAVEQYREACRLAEDYGAAHYALALALRGLGQKAEADQHFALYEKHRIVRPPLEDPLLGAVTELNRGATVQARQALALAQAGRLAEAAQEFERVLQTDPHYAPAHANLIAIYWRLGHLEKAEEHYRKAIEINPNVAEPHLNFALLTAQQNRTEKAAQAFEKALEINPRLAEAHVQYGSLLERQGRLEAAVRHYRLALDSEPNHRAGNYFLGRYLLTLGANDEAIDHLRKTISPDDERAPWYLRALAGAYAATGNRKQAIFYYQEARRRAADRHMNELVGLLDGDLRGLGRR